MTKTELMGTYTAEQLAEMVEKLQEQTEVLQDIATEKERKMKNNIITVVVGEIAKEYQIEEIGDIVRAYEEIRLCKEMNKDCKTILPSEYLKVLSLNQKVSKLQSEVEKYRKAFEEAKKERDCQISDYQNRTEKDKTELERAKNTINQIDDILEKLFGVRHDTIDKPDEFEKILSDKVKGNIADFLQTEPIKVADMLINATYTREKGNIEKTFYKVFGNNSDMVEENVFDISELRQIAEHLLVYCNHNGEDEE